MLQIKEIVNSIFNSKTYILYREGECKAWLVDIGDIEPVVSFLKEKGLTPPDGVFITHAHFDHIYGLPRLAKLYPDVKVFTNSFGREMLRNERRNMSRYHDNPIVFVSDNVVECGEGDRIDVFDDILAYVYYTPGHNPSCLTYEIGGCVFTGDAFIPGVKVVTNLPGADKQMALQSVERIKLLAVGRVVCPGHKTE